MRGIAPPLPVPEEEHMAARNPQTHAKRARELALREKRERKREKKEEAAAAKRAAAEGETLDPIETDDDLEDEPDDDGEDEDDS
jgi:hypothetical protein